MTRKVISWMGCILGLIVFSGNPTPQIGKSTTDGIYFGSSIPSSQVVDNNAILTGDQVVLDGTVNGDVLAIGTDITIGGTIQGSIITFGQRVTLNGTVSGSVYAVTLEMNLGPNAVVGNNIFYAGTNYVSNKGSKVKRDLFAASVGAQLAGEVDRHVNAVIGPVNLVQGFVDAMGGKIVLPNLRQSAPGTPNPSGSSPSGQITSPQYTYWTGGALPASLVTSQQEPVNQNPIADRQQTQLASAVQSQIDASSIGSWAEARLMEWITIALIGLLAIWLLPGLFKRGDEKLRSRPFSAAGYGLFDLVLAVNLVGVIGLLFILIFIIGLWIGPNITWTLSWAVWGTGFFSIGLAIVAIWLFVFFVTKALVAYVGGKLLLDRLVPDVARRRVFPLLLGLVFYVLIASIPMIGWVFDVVVIALGLGAAWLAFRSRSETPTVIVEVEEAEQNMPQEAMDH